MTLNGGRGAQAKPRLLVKITKNKELGQCGRTPQLSPMWCYRQNVTSHRPEISKPIFDDMGGLVDSGGKSSRKYGFAPNEIMHPLCFIASKMSSLRFCAPGAPGALHHNRSSSSSRPLFQIFTQPMPQSHNSCSISLQNFQCNLEQLLQCKQLTQHTDKCNIIHKGRTDSVQQNRTPRLTCKAYTYVGAGRFFLAKLWFYSSPLSVGDSVIRQSLDTSVASRLAGLFQMQHLWFGLLTTGKTKKNQKETGGL